MISPLSSTLQEAQKEFGQQLEELARNELATIAMHQTKEVEQIKGQSSSQASSTKTTEAFRMLKDIGRQAQQLKVELAKVRTDNKSLSETIGQQNVNLATNENELKMLKTNISMQKDQLKALHERREDLEKRNHELIMQKEEIQKKYDCLSADHKLALTKLESKSKELERLKMQQLQQASSVSRDPRIAAKRSLPDAVQKPLPELDAKRMKMSDVSKSVNDQISMGSSLAKELDLDKSDTNLAAKQTEDNLRAQQKELQQKYSLSKNRIIELMRSFDAVQKALKSLSNSLLHVTPLGPSATVKEIEAFRSTHKQPEDNQLFNELQRLSGELNSTKVSPARLGPFIQAIGTAVLNAFYGFHSQLKDSAERVGDLHNKLQTVNMYSKKIDDSLIKKNNQVNEVLDKYDALQTDNALLQTEYDKLKETCQDLMNVVNRMDEMMPTTEADSSIDEQPPVPCTNCEEKEAEINRLKQNNDRADMIAASVDSKERVQLQIELEKSRQQVKELAEQLQAQKKRADESASRIEAIEKQHKSDMTKLAEEKGGFELRVRTAEQTLNERTKQLDEQRQRKTCLDEKLKRTHAELRQLKKDGCKKLVCDRLYAQALIERSAGEDEIARLLQENSQLMANRHAASSTRR